MRKIALILVTLLGAFYMLFIPLVAQAQYNPLGKACQSTSQSGACTSQTKDPLSGSDGVIAKVTQLVVYITSVAAVIMIMIGGWAYITSGGDPQRINGAKNTILYAIIGLVVAISAQLIIKYVLQNVG